jgi:hypothetical protein
MWSSWPVKHPGTGTRTVPARCVQELRRFPGAGLGGDARAAAPARADRTSKPGTTFITAITTGHRQETHECGNLRTLLRRLPLSRANQGCCQAEGARSSARTPARTPPSRGMIRLVAGNPGNSNGSCPDTPSKSGPQLSGYSIEVRSAAVRILHRSPVFRDLRLAGRNWGTPASRDTRKSGCR